MTVKWTIFTLIQYEIIVISSPSIAGVTYMDDFDFEERYTDLNECNPFYWHPLHLPELCADMYEKLIRSRLKTKIPLRLMKERNRKKEKAKHKVEEEIETFPMYEVESYEYESIEGRHKAPYENMLDLLKKDIKKDPSQPKIGMVPNVGPAMIYNQEISKKSENMIKKLATMYGKYAQESYAEYFGYNDKTDPQLYIWDSNKNKTKKGKGKDKNKKKDRITRTKTKHGGVVTIVETLNPRKRRSAIFYRLMNNIYNHF